MWPVLVGAIMHCSNSDKRRGRLGAGHATWQHLNPTARGACWRAVDARRLVLLSSNDLDSASALLICASGCHGCPRHTKAGLVAPWEGAGPVVAFIVKRMSTHHGSPSAGGSREPPGTHPAGGVPGVELTAPGRQHYILHYILHYMHYICVDPGTHLTGDVPRVDTHGESPGVPDSPPHWGFRDEYITSDKKKRRM